MVLVALPDQTLPVVVVHVPVYAIPAYDSWKSEALTLAPATQPLQLPVRSRARTRYWYVAVGESDTSRDLTRREASERLAQAPPLTLRCSWYW